LIYYVENKNTHTHTHTQYTTEQNMQNKTASET
jgi:hypothetical protein